MAGSDPHHHHKGISITAIVGAIVAGAVGLLFVGSQQQAKNQQNNIDDLPALEARLSASESALAAIRSEVSTMRETTTEMQRQQAQQLDRDALNDAFQSLRDALEALEGQLNRRIQLEVKEPLRIELNLLRELIDDVDSDAEDNENLITALAAQVNKVAAVVEAQ